MSCKINRATNRQGAEIDRTIIRIGGCNETIANCYCSAVGDIIAGC